MPTRTSSGVSLLSGIFDAPTCKQTVTFRNTQTQTMRLAVEPRANEYPLQPGERVAVDFESPNPDVVEVELTADVVTVWAPRDSTYEVRRLAD